MMDLPSREHQGDQQGGRVLELLEEKWFSSSSGDGSSSSRPHYDDGGGRTSGVRRRRVYSVNTPEQLAMRPSIFSSRDRESTSRAEEDSSFLGCGKVLPSLSGHVEYQMDASSPVSSDEEEEEEEESPVNHHHGGDDHAHHVKTGRMSVASMVSHACAAIYLVVFVAEVCVDMAACLLDLVRIKRS
ncbi:hypothetical protein M9435_006987 [Picochlorum sp. BPE23]|nr:hypothetical protein M9435_006987 [Picochlorum sp. BPE23]